MCQLLSTWLCSCVRPAQKMWQRLAALASITSSFCFGLLHTTHIDPRFGTKMPVVWSDKAVTTLLGALKPKKCLWTFPTQNTRTKTSVKRPWKSWLICCKGRVRRSKLTLPALKRQYKGYDQLFVKSTENVLLRSHEQISLARTAHNMCHKKNVLVLTRL